METTETYTSTEQLEVYPAVRWADGKPVQVFIPFSKARPLREELVTMINSDRVMFATGQDQFWSRMKFVSSKMVSIQTVNLRIGLLSLLGIIALKMKEKQTMILFLKPRCLSLGLLNKLCRT